MGIVIKSITVLAVIWPHVKVKLLNVIVVILSIAILLASAVGNHIIYDREKAEK